MTDKKSHWEKAHRGVSPDNLSWFQDDPATSYSLIIRSGIARDIPILDVGGGTSRLVDRLLSEGFSRLSVLDISSEAISLARNRLGHRAGGVSWHEDDITSFRPPQQYGLWHDRAVFHFLTGDDERRSYVSVLNNSLLPGGFLVMATFALDGPERCSGLPVVQYDGAKLSLELGDQFSQIEEIEELHITPSAKEQKFSYFLFRRMTATGSG